MSLSITSLVMIGGMFHSLKERKELYCEINPHGGLRVIPCTPPSPGTPEDAGLLPRTVQHIFTTVGEHQYPKNDLKPKFSCNVTRLEEQDVLKEEEKRESIFRITSNLTTTFSLSTMVCLTGLLFSDLFIFEVISLYVLQKNFNMVMMQLMV